MCCLLCFSPDPIEDDPRQSRVNQFQISMMEGLYKNQPVCCLTYCCPPCSAYLVRYRVLNEDMSRYSCCQGYFDGFCCIHAGSCGESKAPQCCLCLEACFCVGPSMSASRSFMMDQYNLRADACDNRLIRFSNCLAIFSCVCTVLACFCDGTNTVNTVVTVKILLLLLMHC